MAKRKHHEDEELELTTLLNIMVVLVSFLLLSAVFSKITIQELNMPAQAGGAAAPSSGPPPVVIEVILRKDALEIGDGKTVTKQALPATDLQAFGSKKLSIPFDATGRKWVRFAMWDVAGNGAFTQPQWLAEARVTK